MENRSKVIQEFFELVIYLNRGNSKANVKTDIAFDIKESKFGCYLKGIQSPQFLVLCIKNRNQSWQPSFYTRFTYLEDYCNDKLNSCEDETKALQIIINSLRNLF